MGVLENYDYRGRDHRRFMGWSFCRLYSDINNYVNLNYYFFLFVPFICDLLLFSQLNSRFRIFNLFQMKITVP